MLDVRGLGRIVAPRGVELEIRDSACAVAGSVMPAVLPQ
jgi:hypothetical protein